MKQGSAMLAAGILLLGAVGLLTKTDGALSPQRGQSISLWLSETQLGNLAAPAVLSESAPAPSVSDDAADSAPVIEAGSSAEAPAAQPVPVTTVQEAWDEDQRQHETLPPAPSPLTVDENISLEIRNETNYAIDFTQLPALPSDLDFASSEPVILLMHTHGSESYTDSDVSGYRTQDPEKSVIAVAEAMKSVLEQRGYAVTHDTTICDEPDFNHAYTVSRQVIQRNLEAYPSIALVLDVHRDAVENENGDQMRMACTIDGQDAAQLMLVVGTDAGGLDHPNWQENLSLAAVLQARITSSASGMMRPINLRQERFNQDLAPMDLLVEVGASGNTLTEAIRSGSFFADALADVLDAYCGKSS